MYQVTHDEMLQMFDVPEPVILEKLRELVSIVKTTRSIADVMVNIAAKVREDDLSKAIVLALAIESLDSFDASVDISL